MRRDSLAWLPFLQLNLEYPLPWTRLRGHQRMEVHHLRIHDEAHGYNVQKGGSQSDIRLGRILTPAIGLRMHLQAGQSSSTYDTSRSFPDSAGLVTRNGLGVLHILVPHGARRVYNRQFLTDCMRAQ